MTDVRTEYPSVASMSKRARRVSEQIRKREEELAKLRAARNDIIRGLYANGVRTKDIGETTGLAVVSVNVVLNGKKYPLHS
jgi:hypothetical protein